MRRLGTYKCQSELVGDQKLNNITSESQTQKLARRIPKSEIGQKITGWQRWKCAVDEMVVEVVIVLWMLWC